MYYLQENLDFESPSPPRYIVLDDFRVDRRMRRVRDWLPPEKIIESRFIAKITNIDEKGNMVLHELGLENRLKLINELINDNFSGAANDFPNLRRIFVGDPCLALYESDAQYYRAKVIDIIDQDTCTVEFIDYGNIQKGVKLDQLYPPICSEIPQLAHRFKFKGSAKNSEGKVDEIFLNKLYRLLVDDDLNVVVTFDPDDFEEIETCSIRVEQFAVEIRDYNQIENIFSKYGKLSEDSDSDDVKEC